MYVVSRSRKVVNRSVWCLRIQRSRQTANDPTLTLQHNYLRTSVEDALGESTPMTLWRCGGAVVAVDDVRLLMGEALG